MRSPRHLVLLICLALLLLLSSVHAETSEQLSKDEQAVRSVHLDPGKGERRHIAPGQESYDEAIRVLRSIRTPPSRIQALTSKPSGFFETTTYYVKELFSLLFMNGPPDLITTKSGSRKLSATLGRAVKLLEDGASQDNPDALFMLAEMNFHGNYTHPRNYPEAFQRYSQLASLNGNSSAQHMVGFMYATGIGGAVKQDQSKAMLYYTFAAEQGDIRSQMTVAYRHHAGIAAPRDCEEAAYYYQQVARKAIEYLRSGPPGNHAIIKEAYRIADDVGGVYGEGASVSSAGPNAKQGGPNTDTHAALGDVLEYLDLMSRKGDIKATYSLGKLYYDGARGMDRDVRVAKNYFMDVARHYWSSNGKPKRDVAPGIERTASKAAGYIGRMFLRGEGTRQNFERAKIWFERGLKNGDALCQYSMGLMYLHGYGVEKDTYKAAQLFSPAADEDLASAQVQLGILFLDQGDVSTAVRYFDLAARNGHIEAYYYLAEIIHQGIGRESNCAMATLYYKIVSEKAEIILSSFPEANAAYESGDLETALVDYMLAAEQGFEIAQANVAYLLDQAQPRFTFRSLIPFISHQMSLVSDAALALVYWTRSAMQQNIDSRVKMGDYYLYGFGTPPNEERAAACYQAAAETMQSAQAMWNLGWMHENGVGIEQDFHLAKRFYDQALETNREAYLPVSLALLKLRARSFWNTITHGRVNSIHDEPVPKKQWSFSEWVANFIEADLANYEGNVEHDEWGERFDNMPGGDDYIDDIDEGVIESLVIVALATALMALFYYRQRRMAEQREQQQRQQRNGAQAGAAVDGAQNQNQNQGQGGGGGLFPQPGDPDFLNWAVGGVGH